MSPDVQHVTFPGRTLKTKKDRWMNTRRQGVQCTAARGGGGAKKSGRRGARTCGDHMVGTVQWSRGPGRSLVVLVRTAPPGSCSCVTRTREPLQQDRDYSAIEVQ
jgi:hypothetical protein